LPVFPEYAAVSPAAPFFPHEIRRGRLRDPLIGERVDEIRRCSFFFFFFFLFFFSSRELAYPLFLLDDGLVDDRTREGSFSDEWLGPGIRVGDLEFSPRGRRQTLLHLTAFSSPPQIFFFFSSDE